MTTWELSHSRFLQGTPVPPYGVLAVVLLVLTGGAQAQDTRIAGCPLFPADNIWNTPVTDLPVDPQSEGYVASIGTEANLHADFGAGLYDGAPIGIPFVIVPADQPKVDVVLAGFADEPQPYADESDIGPAPIPVDAPIEGGPASQDDRHVIVVQEQSCTLFELYRAVPNADGSWSAVGSVRFDLESNDLRPAGWTSADAAGLPIFPGLVRYDEVVAGVITHALRFTAPRTRDAYVWPARHDAADSDDPGLPPMGQRFRLKPSFDISGFSPRNQVILRALQTYGMILAENGSAWFLSGAPDSRWDNDEVQRELSQLRGSDFEAVDVSRLMQDAGSAAAGP
jgi:hypothetical protein